MTTAELVAEIVERSNRAFELEHLCGSMIATLAISRNRERILEGDAEAIQSLIAISDRWADDFNRITGRQPK